MRASLENHIVGIRMEIATLEGKWKLSQNKALEVRPWLADGLEADGEPDSAQIAALMRKLP